MLHLADSLFSLPSTEVLMAMVPGKRSPWGLLHLMGIIHKPRKLRATAEKGDNKGSCHVSFWLKYTRL